MNSAERYPEEKRYPEEIWERSRRAASYERMLEQTTLAVVECTTDGRIVRWNEGAARLFGYSEAEAIGRPLAGTLLTDTDEIGDDWRGLFADGASPARTWTGVRKDGSACVCAWSCHPVDEDIGRPAGLLFLGHESPAQPESARRRDQEALLLRAILDHVNMVVWAIDPQGTFTFHDGKALTDMGFQPGLLVGKNVFDLYSSKEHVQRMQGALAGVPDESTTHEHDHFWKNWCIPVRSEGGQVESVVAVSLDVTDMKRLEQEAQGRLEVLERQQRVIRALSTPILEVWEGVLALPMIGVVDGARTAEVMDALLEAVVRKQARFAILDLTGVDAVDPETASSLIRLIHAIELLGAEGIITGIRATVAQTLVAIGVDLGAVTTLGNLRAGLRHCIARMARDGRGGGGLSNEQARAAQATQTRAALSARPPPPEPGRRGGG